MERAGDAEITEDCIGLRILVDKGIACQSVVFEELLFCHGSRFLVVKSLDSLHHPQRMLLKQS
jgi:hypothetical protein